MPRAFTTEEAARIRERLKAVGAEAFGRRGIRGTSIEELAAAAGISKGAFYRFFDSKESLLLVLLDEYEAAMHREIEDAIRAEPGRGLEVLISMAVHAAERNPLFAVIMSAEGRRAIQSRSPTEQRDFLERDVQLVRRVLTLMREAGSPLDIPDDVLLGLTRSLTIAGMYRDDIGSGLVDAVTEWLPRALHRALRSAGTEAAP